MNINILESEVADAIVYYFAENGIKFQRKNLYAMGGGNYQVSVDIAAKKESPGPLIVAGVAEHIFKWNDTVKKQGPE